jgi:tetratricopeptide (TPR) repeat protein
MFKHTFRRRIQIAVVIAWLGSACGTSLGAVKYEEAVAAFNGGDYAQARKLLESEIEQNPGNEEAYMLLGKSLEELGDNAASLTAWETLKKITRSEQTESDARRQMLRLEAEIATGKEEKPSYDDPFHVEGINIDYKGLDVVEDANYRNNLPPIQFETQNFIVYACNEKLAETVGKLSEQYLQFLRERLLDGRGWAFRVPILVYKDRDDYVKVGGMPDTSVGVTYPDHSGRSLKVAIFQLHSEEQAKALGFKNRVSDNLEDTLPHELTHVVINEFFGAQEIPKWLHEAFARQMEQNRDDYTDAAELARDAVAGEYFRFRDFFAIEHYPTGGEVFRFYEQAATVVLFLLEQGPEATRAFLTELAEQRGHDAAIAAAFGISEEGAVEEFEKKWVTWMTERYKTDLKRSDREDPKLARTSTADVFRGAFDENASINAVEKWTTVKPTDEGQFAGIGESLRDWELTADSIESRMPDEKGQTMVAVRSYDDLPLAIKGKVRWTGNEEDNLGWFGITVLDQHREDTGAQVMAMLEDNRPHDLTCVISNEIAVFLDGRCTGRYPVPPMPPNVDIDYPFALVARSPVQLSDLKIGSIAVFADITEAAASDQPGGGGGGTGGGGGGNPPPQPPPKSGGDPPKPPKPAGPPKPVGP